jgi:hypothetical protein
MFLNGLTASPIRVRGKPWDREFCTSLRFVENAICIQQGDIRKIRQQIGLYLMPKVMQELSSDKDDMDVHLRITRLDAQDVEPLIALKDRLNAMNRTVTFLDGYATGGCRASEEERQHQRELEDLHLQVVGIVQDMAASFRKMVPKAKLEEWGI